MSEDKASNARWNVWWWQVYLYREKQNIFFRETSWYCHAEISVFFMIVRFSFKIYYRISLCFQSKLTH